MSDQWLCRANTKGIYPYCIVTSECAVVGKDVRWRNNQNKSCRFRKVMQLGRSQPFYLKSNFDAEIFDSQDCIELIPKESICSIVTSECVVVENDLRWRNGQNKSCRSQKVMQLCSRQCFHLKSFIQGKLRLNVLIFEIQILQTASDGQMIQTKVVGLKSYNFFLLTTFSFEFV